MFKGIRNNPKRQSSQDVIRNTNTSTTFIDALGNAGPVRSVASPTEPIAYPSHGHPRPTDSNKENRPTVRAELFVNVPRPVTPRQRAPTNNSSSSSEEENRPLAALQAAKRASTVLPPSANLAQNNNYPTSADEGSARDITPRKRNTTNGGYESDPGRSAGHSCAMSGSGGAIGVGSAKGWGFEFLDHPPPESTLLPESPVKNGPLSTHAEFNKMLDDLQIPPTLRPRLQTLETPVKAAMLRSSQVLTIAPPGSSAMGPSASEPSPSPTKSKFKGTYKDKDKKNKFQTEKYGDAKSSHAPNPFMFNRNGGDSGKTTPKKGKVRRTQSGGSLNESPRGTLGTPYSQMQPGGKNGSAYNLALGQGQDAALKFMFPSLDGDEQDDELLPPPTLAQLQNGYVPPPMGHTRGSSFDSGMGSRSDLNLARAEKIP